MDQQANISLGGQEYIVLRARLGTYLALQAAFGRIRKVGKTGDNGAICDAVLAYLCISVPGLDIASLMSAKWQDIIMAIVDIEELNKIDAEFAIFKVAGSANKLPVPWDHDDRARFYWVHLIADAYHWSKEEIENLWPEEAVAFIQEILADEQYEREFEHSLAEVAYSYDKATKKSKYVPLHRPPWMVLRDPKTLITRMHRYLMPVGVVVYPGEEETVH